MEMPFIPVRTKNRNATTGAKLSTKILQWTAAANAIPPKTARRMDEPLDQAARDRNALLHAAGEFVRMALAEAFEADQLQRILCLGAPLGLGDAAQGQREFDVLLRRQPRKQARLLEHHADAVRIGLKDRRVVDQDRPGSLLAQAGHHHQQRRFSAAARAHQHHEAARLHLERDVRQRHHVLCAGLEDLADIADLDRAGARGRLQRGYVRQWLHRVSTDRTSSLNVMAMAAIITTPASNCFIWKFSPQVAI